MNQQSLKISSTQFTLLIYKTQIGFSILNLPRVLIRAVDTDGWIIVLLGCLVSILMGFLIIYIMRAHPNETLFDILPRYVGKWIAKLIILIWTIYTLLVAAIGLFTTIFLVNTWILPNTPGYLLMMLFLIPIYMVTVQEIKIIARFAEFVFLMGVLMPLLVFFSLKDVEWLNLLPVLKTGWEPIIKNIPLVFPAYYGFELVYFWYSFLDKKKKAVKGIVISNLLTMHIMLIVVIFTFVKFSYKENVQSLWPSVNLLKLIQFPFAERLEGVFISFYLYLIIATIIPYLYAAWLGIRNLVGKSKTGEGKVYLFLILAIWLVIPFVYTLNYGALIQIQEMWNKFSLWIVFYFTIAFACIVFGMQRWKRVRSG